MGFLALVGAWIAPAVRVVRNVVQTIDRWLNGPSLSDEYELFLRKMPTNEVEAKRRSRKNLDFLSEEDSSLLENKIGDVKKLFNRQSKDQALENKKLRLQTEVMKLAICASVFDRYVQNIKLHASNLSIHLQTIRNVKGLTDDVNSLRFGLKKAISTINHMANIMNSQDQHVNKIQGVDIEIKEGAISLNAAYRAFEQTRGLLLIEVTSLSELANEHIADIHRVQEYAANLGQYGQKVIDFLDERVAPSLERYNKMGITLKSEIKELPIIPEKESSDTTIDANQSLYTERK